MPTSRVSAGRSDGACSAFVSERRSAIARRWRNARYPLGPPPQAGQDLFADRILAESGLGAPTPVFRPNAQRESIGTNVQRESWPNVARTEGIRPRESYALAYSGPGGFPKLRRGRQNKAPARSDADRAEFSKHVQAKCGSTLRHTFQAECSSGVNGLRPAQAKPLGSMPCTLQLDYAAPRVGVLLTPANSNAN